MSSPRGRSGRRPTLDEVAARAGVGRGTASRVINGSPQVSEQAREAVRRAIAELGYVPNRAARALVTRRTDSVALVVSESPERMFEEPFFAGIVRGISSVLSETPMQLWLAMAQSPSERERVEHHLTTQHVDGVMLLSLHDEDPLPALLASRGLPTVLGGRPARMVRPAYGDSPTRPAHGGGSGRPAHGGGPGWPAHGGGPVQVACGDGPVGVVRGDGPGRPAYGGGPAGAVRGEGSGLGADRNTGDILAVADGPAASPADPSGPAGDASALPDGPAASLADLAGSPDARSAGLEDAAQHEDESPIRFVDVDNAGGARLAVEYLLGRGRSVVGVIAGPQDMGVGVARLAGYRRAIEAAGQVFCSDLVAFGDFGEPSGAAAVRRLLAARPDLDAVFAASDLMAAGAVRALREDGRRVPDDVAVVGFEDSPVARQTEPPLTTVHQSVEAMGREMARLLLARIAGGDAHSVVLDTYLVVRESA